MIARTHHAAFWCVDTSAKAFAALPLSMATIYKLQASVLLTGPHMLSLGFKMHWSKSLKSCDCDQRSQPRFHPWSHSNRWISAITTLFLGNVMSLYNRMRQDWKCSAATGNPDFISKTYRVLLVPAFISSMFSIYRQQGKIKTMKYLPAVETFVKGLFSTPGLVQRTPLVYPILLKRKYSQIHWHNYQ